MPTMPLYEYACQSCEHTFEALIFGAEKVECPECEGSKVERLLSVPARPRTSAPSLPMNCGEGPPCGAPTCGRLR
jgi:putative FmdB family regulatory protein